MADQTIDPQEIWINSAALRNLEDKGSHMVLLSGHKWNSASERLYTAAEHEALQAMYNAQCQATDEWHEAFLEERAAKSPERIAELEKQLAEMNQRYAELQEAMDRMAPYEGAQHESS